MITRSRAAVAATMAGIFGVSVVHNRVLYGPNRWNTVLTKSLIDTIFVILLCTLIPILLLVWSGAFVTEKIVMKTWRNRYWIVTVTCFVGIGITLLAGLSSPATILLSVLPTNIITGQIWARYKRLQTVRENPSV